MTEPTATPPDRPEYSSGQQTPATPSSVSDPASSTEGAGSAAPGSAAAEAPTGTEPGSTYAQPGSGDARSEDRQTVEFPPAGYPQPGHQQAGYPPIVHHQPFYQQAGYPPIVHQQAGYPPGIHGQPARPQTAHAPDGYPGSGDGRPGPGGGSFGPPPPPSDPGDRLPGSGPGPGRSGRRRGPIWIGVGVLAVIAVVIGVLVGVDQLGPKDPDEAVSWALDDLATWGGITYRGELRDVGDESIEVDLTVNPDGDIAGTLVRPNGGRAEYAMIGGVELLRAEPSWWNGELRTTDKVERLAGTWVKNVPSDEVPGVVDRIPSPDEVASALEPTGLSSSYRENGIRYVAGRSDRALYSDSDAVIVSQGNDPHLLAFAPTRAQATDTLEVSRPDPAALGRIAEGRSIKDTASDYTSTLEESANVTAQVLDAAAVCSTTKCTVTVRLTNQGRFDADGVVTVSANGQRAGSKSFFTLHGGQSQDLQVHADNLAAPGQTLPVRWEAEVTAH